MEPPAGHRLRPASIRTSAELDRQPTVAAWEVTRACPYRCAHRRADARPLPPPGQLDRDEALDLVDRLAPFAGSILVLTGGDPLLRPDLVERDAPVEVLAVDDYPDGPALYLRELGRDPVVAERIHERLSWNGGARNAGGTGLAAVDWEGRVKPDQFWGGPVLGSARERPLSQIWTDPPPEPARLRQRSDDLTGRRAGCRFLALCGGGVASRALASGAGLEGSDPGCHLSDAEIGAAA